MSHVLLTGSGGFLGRRLKQMLEARGDTVCAPRWTGYGLLDWGDFRQSEYVIHAGADTNVEYSLQEPEQAIRANFNSTMSMIEVARHLPKLRNFCYVSTAEVYGPANFNEFWFENQSYNCRSPYAASKAAGEQFVMAYANAYKLPMFIAVTMNLYGEGQSPKKFIPMVINKVLVEEPVPIHWDPKTGKSGSRCYTHVDDAASGIIHLLGDHRRGERYHVVGEDIDNLELAGKIAEIIGKPLKYDFVDFHSSHPGHDLRYAIKDTKLWMEWRPKAFCDRLKQTVEWYLDARSA